MSIKKLYTYRTQRRRVSYRCGQRFKNKGQQVDKNMRMSLSQLFVAKRWIPRRKKNTFKTLNELMKKIIKTVWLLGSLIIILPRNKLRLFTPHSAYPRKVSLVPYSQLLFFYYFFFLSRCKFLNETYPNDERIKHCLVSF